MIENAQKTWKEISLEANREYRFACVYTDAANDWYDNRHLYPGWSWADFWKVYGQRRLGDDWAPAPVPDASEAELEEAWEVLEALSEEYEGLIRAQGWVEDDRAIRAGRYSYAGALAQIEAQKSDLDDEIQAAQDRIARLQKALDY